MRVASMNQSEFYDHVFKLQDAADKIIKTIDSIRNVTTEHRAFMIKSMRNFAYEWYAQCKKFYTGWFWQIRKRVLRQILEEQYERILTSLTAVESCRVLTH